MTWNLRNLTLDSSADRVALTLTFDGPQRDDMQGNAVDAALAHVDHMLPALRRSAAWRTYLAAQAAHTAAGDRAAQAREHLAATNAADEAVFTTANDGVEQAERDLSASTEALGRAHTIVDNALDRELSAALPAGFAKAQAAEAKAMRHLERTIQDAIDGLAVARASKWLLTQDSALLRSRIAIELEEE